MNHRSVVPTSFEEYLAADDDSLEDRAAQQIERKERLLKFPHSVMLQAAFPEIDFANRWCWQNFGPCDGECMQHSSIYPVCNRSESHAHIGKWSWHFYVKTEYDFGFIEWYFANSSDCEQFLANIENINWGERFPKY